MKVPYTLEIMILDMQYAGSCMVFNSNNTQRVHVVG